MMIYLFFINNKHRNYCSSKQGTDFIVYMRHSSDSGNLANVVPITFTSLNYGCTVPYAELGDSLFSPDFHQNVYVRRSQIMASFVQTCLLTNERDLDSKRDVY